MCEMIREEVIMPGGVELVQEAERHIQLNPGSRVLSVACGTGEIELYLARKYGCSVLGLDIGDWAVTKARKKAIEQGLQDKATFQLGDGADLRFDPATFDFVFCSGCICEFFEAGMKAFHQVLRAKGRAVIIEVIWRTNEVPSDVALCWTEGRAKVFTLADNEKAFVAQGFRTILAREYHEPRWWEAYYHDRGDAPHWQEERENYRKHQDYIGLGLFVLEKS